MRKRDLASSDNIAPGIYLLDGEEGDPDARVVGGPYPNTDDGKLTVAALAEQLARRTRRPACWCLVTDLVG